MRENGGVLMKLLLTAAIAGFIPSVALAQTFPSKPIRLIVAAAPGAGIDTLARMVAQKASQGLGQQMVVENMAGASGLIAAAQVARSAPDGYTLLVGTDASQSAHLYQKTLSYDPATDFAPITGGGLSVTCMAVSSSLPVSSIDELVDYAKRNPGKLSFGSGGGTTTGSFYLAGQFFKTLTGTDFVGVPYKGLADVMTQLLGGRVTVGFTTVSTALPQQQAGKVKILAITDSKRYPLLSTIPTLAEAVPGFAKAATWNGYFAPVGTPQAVVRRLNVEMVNGLNFADPSRLLGITLIGGTPEEFAAFVKEQNEILSKLLKMAGIQPQ